KTVSKSAVRVCDDQCSRERKARQTAVIKGGTHRVFPKPEREQGTDTRRAQRARRLTNQLSGALRSRRRGTGSSGAGFVGGDVRGRCRKCNTRSSEYGGFDERRG